MWRLKAEAKDWSGIAGVPWRDMTDQEFEAVSADYDRQFPEEPGSLSRWFDHDPERVEETAPAIAEDAGAGAAEDEEGR